MLGYQENGFFFETDLDKAKELLAAAGIPEGTELVADDEHDHQRSRYLELFQANLAEIGITLTIEAVDQVTFIGIFYGDTPAEERPNFMSWGWWPDYNDAWNVLYPTTSCDSWGSQGSNGGFYCNEEVDKLLAEAKDASTLESYKEILDKMQTIISKDDLPVISFAQPKWPTVLQANIEGSPSTPSTSAPTTSGSSPGRRSGEVSRTTRGGRSRSGPAALVLIVNSPRPPSDPAGAGTAKQHRGWSPRSQHSVTGTPIRSLSSVSAR